MYLFIPRVCLPLLWMNDSLFITIITKCRSSNWYICVMDVSKGDTWKFERGIKPFFFTCFISPNALLFLVLFSFFTFICLISCLFVYGPYIARWLSFTIPYAGLKYTILFVTNIVESIFVLRKVLEHISSIIKTWNNLIPIFLFYPFSFFTLLYAILSTL